jgi:hypothetical protein
LYLAEKKTPFIPAWHGPLSPPLTQLTTLVFALEIGTGGIGRSHLVAVAGARPAVRPHLLRRRAAAQLPGALLLLDLQGSGGHGLRHVPCSPRHTVLRRRARGQAETTRWRRSRSGPLRDGAPPLSSDPASSAVLDLEPPELPPRVCFARSTTVCRRPAQGAAVRREGACRGDRIEGSGEGGMGSAVRPCSRGQGSSAARPCSRWQGCSAARPCSRRQGSSARRMS